MYITEHEMAKQRMTEFIKDRENDRLARDLRQAMAPSRNVGVRAIAFVMTLFRV